MFRRRPGTRDVPGRPARELPFERLHPRLQRRIRSLATTLLRVILRGRKRRA